MMIPAEKGVGYVGAQWKRPFKWSFLLALIIVVIVMIAGVSIAFTFVVQADKTLVMGSLLLMAVFVFTTVIMWNRERDKFDSISTYFKMQWEEYLERLRALLEENGVPFEHIVPPVRFNPRSTVADVAILKIKGGELLIHLVYGHGHTSVYLGPVTDANGQLIEKFKVFIEEAGDGERG
jgi:hypothetical protein